MFRCKTPCADLSVSTLTPSPLSINHGNRPPPVEFALSSGPHVSTSLTGRFCAPLPPASSGSNNLWGPSQMGHLLAPEGAMPVLAVPSASSGGEHSEP